MCGNGSGRMEHPAEVLGDDWYLWEGMDAVEETEISETPEIQDKSEGAS